MTTRQLVAWINGARVGILEDREGIWCFQYDPSWREHALSPCLPLQHEAHVDSGSSRQVQWFFDNLLPEERQRGLLAKEAHLADEHDAFALLAAYGAESAGSLTLLAPGIEPGSHPREGVAGQRPLGDEQLELRIRDLPNVSLSQGAVKSMSIAGAQHKLGVILDHGVLFEPAGQMPSTHILKPEHTDTDYRQSVVNEWFVMTLASRVGLCVPDVQRRYVPSPVYLIERFDRDGTRRLHANDGCQMLGLDRSRKYLAGSIEALVRLAQLTRYPAATAQALYVWLIFNTLVANNDAHLKNISFLVDRGGARLAPFYDMLSTAYYETQAAEPKRVTWPRDTQLSWPILGVTRFADLTRPVMIRAGLSLGLAPASCHRLLDEVCHKTLRHAAALLAATEADNVHRSQSDADFRLKSAGELRMLRALCFMIITPLARQLGRTGHDLVAVSAREAAEACARERMAVDPACGADEAVAELAATGAPADDPRWQVLADEWRPAVDFATPRHKG